MSGSDCRSSGTHKAMSLEPQQTTISSLQPTLSMQPVCYEDGSWGVSVMVTGLASQQQAEAAMLHMQELFCGPEIVSN